jgi:uncharacterized lipoprotein YddW (UPF0748 family)
MKKIYSLFIFIVCVCEILQAQTAPKREMRGAWIATYANIDWPATGTTSTQDKASFRARLDEHKTSGMNAVFVQVRSLCDALYTNPFEPWSAILSGVQGAIPDYDPLTFMITEARQRGLEFHAWFNPYRAASYLRADSLSVNNAISSTHVTKEHPNWVMLVNSGVTQQKLLNPGAPEVQDHIVKVVMHVVRNYDVDGIHFDDYFYTNPATTTYNDDSVYTIHNRGIANRGDWRRSNVDTLIKRLNDSIKSVKPWIKFGISPSGIWMSQANDATGSNTSAGALQHKKDLYANSKLWLQQGWIDYLAPQVYWYIGQTGSDYNILAPWWSSNNFGRHIYMGQAGYKVGDAAQNAAFATDKTQIPRQVRLNRSLAGINGQVVYNTTSLRNNPLGFRDSLRLNLYNRPALLPTMPWKDNIAPSPVNSLAGVKLANNTISLTWVNPPAAVATEMDVVKRFAIYRGINTMPDINNPADLIAITNTDVSTFIDTDVSLSTTYNYVVTAIDRLYNESVASNTATVSVGALPLNLISFSAEKNGNKNVLLTWQTANEINTDFFEVQRSFKNSSFDKIAFVKANDGSNQFNYNTTDYNLLESGTYFYRLKMADKDGRFTFSDIKKITVNNANLDIAAYSNPIKSGGSLQLTWPGTNGKILYRILNTEGRILVQNNCAFVAGIANLRLNNVIVPGNYIVQCFTNEKVSSLKIVVQ